MKRVHYIDNYLIDPQHPVTVNLIGAGGTGSQVLTCLARLDVTLRALGHPGLSVTLYDPDIVSGTNIGRQLFSDSDIGLNKAKCLITRVNNFFGNDWKAEPRPYPSVLKEVKRDEIANITVTCTDNIKSRLDLWNVLGKMPPASYTDNATPLYWMDFGNTQTTGQVIMGTVLKKIRQPASTLYEAVGSLKVITRFVKYARVKEEDSGPSRPYPSVLKEVKRDEIANITVTCTDNIKSRLDLWNVLGKMPPASYTDNATPLYWMDFGNTQTTGQVIMGTVLKKIRQPASTLYEAVGSLKVITRFVKYARVKEEDSGPSCSLAEALEKQDLFINSTLAQLGCNILWKMFRNGMIEHHGVYLNLATMKVNPISI